MQHEQHGGRGEVAGRAEQPPRALECARPKVQRCSERLEHAISAGVGDPVADGATLESTQGEKIVDIAANMLADQIGDRGREHDLKPTVHDVPSHHALGVGIEDRARRDDARRAAALHASDLRAGDDGRGSAVANSDAAITLAIERSALELPVLFGLFPLEKGTEVQPLSARICEQIARRIIILRAALAQQPR